MADTATGAAGAGAEAPAEEIDMSWEFIWESLCSEFGGYTTLAIATGIFLKALINTMYPVNGQEAQIKSKSPYTYLALFCLGLYGQAMTWIFKETDFQPGLMTSVIKLGPRCAWRLLLLPECSFVCAV